MPDNQDNIAFVRTGQRNGQSVLILARTDKVNVDSLRKAFNAGAKPLMRDGMITMTVEEAEKRLGDMPDNMSKSRAEITRGIDIAKKASRIGTLTR